MRQMVVLLRPVAFITLPMRHSSRSMNSLLVAVMSKLLLYCSNCNQWESIEFQSMDDKLKKNMRTELSGWMNKEKKLR